MNSAQTCRQHEAVTVPKLAVKGLFLQPHASSHNVMVLSLFCCNHVTKSAVLYQVPAAQLFSAAPLLVLPAECHHVVRCLSCYIGVAISVSTHPATEPDWCGIQGQLTTCMLLEGSRQSAQE